MKYQKTLVGVLGVAAAMQLALLRGASKPEGPTMGHELPMVMAQLLTERFPRPLAGIMGTSRPCTLLVLMSVRCAFCKRMRHTWYQQFIAVSDSAKLQPAAIWMFPDSADAVRSFELGFPMEGIQSAVTSADAFEALGAFATPITYVVDSLGRLRLGLAGNQLPSRSELATSCEAGAP